MDDIDNALNELSPSQIDELGYEFELWKGGFYKDQNELERNVHSLITSFQAENRSH